jgi:hypothetical protein
MTLARAHSMPLASLLEEVPAAAPPPVVIQAGSSPSVMLTGCNIVWFPAPRRRAICTLSMWRFPRSGNIKISTTTMGRNGFTYYQGNSDWYSRTGNICSSQAIRRISKLTRRIVWRRMVNRNGERNYLLPHKRKR